VNSSWTGRRKGAHHLLRHHERHHLAMQRTVVEPDHAIHADRDEATAVALEDRRPEWTSGAVLDVRA
jgi:hypothetical protein